MMVMIVESITTAIKVDPEEMLITVSFQRWVSMQVTIYSAADERSTA